LEPPIKASVPFSNGSTAGEPGSVPKAQIHGAATAADARCQAEQLRMVLAR